MSSLPSASAELEVPFHDVDALRIVWHGHYYKYMEIARTKLLRQLGVDGPRLTALGYQLLVIETKCRYISPLRYADQLRITARFVDIEYRLNIAYDIYNVTAGRRCAKGHTYLVTIDSAGTMLMETPAALKEMILV